MDPRNLLSISSQSPLSLFSISCHLLAISSQYPFNRVSPPLNILSISSQSPLTLLSSPLISSHLLSISSHLLSISSQSPPHGLGRRPVLALTFSARMKFPGI